MIREACSISPAFGRDYKSGTAAKEDFLRGEDFKLESIRQGTGTYCSIRDFEIDAFVEIRYGPQNRKVVGCRVPANALREGMSA